MRPTTSILLATSFIILFSLLFIAIQPAQAAPGTYIPVTVTQPDGTELELFASGDEYYNWLHDANGYTVMQDPVTGYYVYADLVDGELVPTELMPEVDDPAAAGLVPQLNISAESRQEIRREFLAATPEDISNTPKSGTITDLVVFICFQAPDPCFQQSAGPPPVTEPASKYTNMLNTATSSLRSYFLEASYNQLTIDSLLFPVPTGPNVIAFTDSHARGYFQPYNVATNPIGYQGCDTCDERRLREHALLRDAIASIPQTSFPSGATIDADGDGRVDDVTFIISGSPNGWASLLWPHAWSLYTYNVQINGKYVYRYQFQMQSMTNSSVLAHETFHVVGAPDLYRYSDTTIDPVGAWDLMAHNQSPPQHMSCFMKWKYGNWISSIPELTTAGDYTLNPMGPSGECYKVASPNSSTEYYILEYRRDAGTFESSLPASGLLVWRINPAAGSGNADGPPDEVYVYRPDGTLEETGDLNQAYFSSQSGRTAINDSTNPSPFLQDGSPGGLEVDTIGSAGPTISFHVDLPTTYLISGNAGTPGATLSYYSGGSKTATADALGDYSFSVPEHWNGAVTPSKINFAFTPDHLDYMNVSQDWGDQDYSAVVSMTTPIIGNVYPPAGATNVCRTPPVGVNLILAALVRAPTGSLDPTTVTLLVDNVDRTGQVKILETASSPPSEALILYTPTSNLPAGNHTGTFIYPSPGGPLTYGWSFTVATATCPVTAPAETPVSEEPSVEALLDPSVEVLASAAIATDAGSLAATESGEELTAPAEAVEVITAPAVKKVGAAALQPRVRRPQ